MPTGLNQPYEVYFFTKAPDDHKAEVNPSFYDSFYEIDKAQNEHMLDAAKASTKNRALVKMIQFNPPEVEVHGNEYTYVVRSTASREDFRRFMSPESVKRRDKPTRATRGLHYSAGESYGDAIGITIRTDTPEEAKKQFQAWYATIKQELNALSDRFEIVNKEIEKQIDAAVAKRLDELQRAKKAL